MSEYLCISVRFADPSFRGRGDGGEPEWPPSPLRMFQALVAACAARFGNPERFRDYAVPAFGWLGALRPPLVVAPAGATGTPFRLAVPNNDMDAVGRCWARNAEPDPTPAQLKTLKTVRPTHIVGGEEFPAVHYLWAVADADKAGCEQHKETLFAAARSIVALGWGVDMVVGHGQTLDDAGVRALKGERWNPAPEGGTRLRVPVVGTFDALVGRHRDFLNRLPTGGFVPVPPLTAFAPVGYRRDTETASRPWVAFRITAVDPDAPNPAFDTPGHARDVAAWVRHATATVCEHWPFPDVAAFVHGHAENGNQTKGERADERFMYLPLPTINAKLNRVESIRRVLIAAPPGFEDRIDWIARRLPGQELVWGDEVKGTLGDLAGSDWVLGRYTGESRVWSTVTPVVWPGHDDRDPEKAERLLRKAFADAGLPRGEAGGIVELDWRPVGFRAGVDLASRYNLPDRLNGHRYHVRVRFAHPVSGPLAVGAGRYRGVGVFAAEVV